MPRVAGGGSVRNGPIEKASDETKSARKRTTLASSRDSRRSRGGEAEEEP